MEKGQTKTTNHTKEKPCLSKTQYFYQGFTKKERNHDQPINKRKKILKPCHTWFPDIAVNNTSFSLEAGRLPRNSSIFLPSGDSYIKK